VARHDLTNIADRKEIVGIVDIGTAKICCLIAVPQPGAAGAPPSMRFLGLGQQRSRGIKAGLVIDLDQAERAIRDTVAQAERDAGVTLDEVHVSIGGAHLRSDHFAASADVEHGVVGNGDIGRLMDGARNFAEREGRTLVHMNRLGFRLDRASGIREPRGLAGRQLSGDIHTVTADEAAVRNLRLLVERCLLRPSRLVPSGLASARAVATPAELRGGVTVIDLGAGATSIAVVSDDHDLFADTVTIGGNHITYDLMRALETPLAEAERIKALYGTMLEAGSDDREVVTFPRARSVDSEASQTTKARLHGLIRPRIESLLDQATAKLEASGVGRYGGDGVVLTGGGAQLLGVAEFASQRLRRPVRIGKPRPLSAMPDSLGGPAFATAIGLVAATQWADALHVGGEPLRPAGSYLGRMGQWLRQSF